MMNISTAANIVLFFAGFCGSWLLFFLIDKAYKKQKQRTENVIQIITKWCSYIVHTLVLISLYLALFMAGEILGDRVTFFPIIQALSLLGIWWVSGALARTILTGEESFDKNSGWYNWSNLVALFSAFIIGWFAIYRSGYMDGYWNLVSLIISVGIGVFISSDAMFMGKGFAKDIQKKFHITDRKTFIIGIIITAGIGILTYFCVLQQKHIASLNTGFVIGSILVAIGMTIQQRLR